MNLGGKKRGDREMVWDKNTLLVFDCILFSLYTSPIWCIYRQISMVTFYTRKKYIIKY